MNCRQMDMKSFFILAAVFCRIFLETSCQMQSLYVVTRISR